MAALVGEVYRSLPIKPILDCWDSKEKESQKRLRAYLERVKHDLGPLPSANKQLFLRMDVVVKPEQYLCQHDLDNYLRPVAHTLNTSRFVFVSATKRVEGDSRLLFGEASPGDEQGRLTEHDGWRHAFINAGSGPDKKDWKVQVRKTLLSQQIQHVASGPVEVHLSWRCSSQRNWTSLWKPTIDAMGPILGEPKRRFDPDDGRIVSLGLHLTRDDTIGWSIDIGMYWRLFPA